MSSTMQLTVHSELDLVPNDKPCQRVLEITVQAPEAARVTQRPRLNLALVLDRSGSMSGEKLAYVQQAAQHVIDLLDRQDRVSLVVFDDEVDVVIGSTPMIDANSDEMKRKIAQIRSGNSTNLGDGWLKGCELVAGAMAMGQLNRALLLTDGLANVGITDEEVLGRHAQELAARGVSTSTFGVGHGFNEHLLDTMASQGSGNFYFINRPSEIPSVFAREFNELSSVTAKGVELELTFPPQVNPMVLGGWRCDSNGSRMRIYLGDLYSNRNLSIYIKLLLPPSTGQTEMPVTVQARATGTAEQVFDLKETFTYRYADEETVKNAAPKRDLLERYAVVEMGEVSNKALKLERMGEHIQASVAVRQTLEEVQDYLKSDQKVEFQQMADRMERGMDEYDLKFSHNQNYQRRKGRSS